MMNQKHLSISILLPKSDKAARTSCCQQRHCWEPFLSCLHSGVSHVRRSCGWCRNHRQLDCTSSIIHLLVADDKFKRNPLHSCCFPLQLAQSGKRVLLLEQHHRGHGVGSSHGGRWVFALAQLITRVSLTLLLFFFWPSFLIQGPRCKILGCH